MNKISLDTSWYDSYNRLYERSQTILSCKVTLSLFDDVPHIRIMAFETIVAECKEELNHIDIDQVIAVVKVLTSTDVSDVEKSSTELNTYFNKFLNPSGDCAHYTLESANNCKCPANGCMAGEHYLLNIERTIDEITTLQDELSFYLKNISRQKFFFFFKYDTSQADELYKKCEDLKKTLVKQLEVTSEYIIHGIKVNFYTLYVSLNYLLHYIQMSNDLVLAIEIAHIIDRILRVIKPSFSGHAMQDKYLIYYHIEYEFKELYQTLALTIDQQT